MTGDDEISEAGRQARFAQWEKLGVEAIKQDLATGGLRFVGGTLKVQALALEWVRMKEAEKAAREDADAQAVLRALGAAPIPVSDLLSGRDSELDRAVKAALQSTALAPAAVSPPATAPTPTQEKPVEMLTLKPTIYGVGIDLKEAGRRLRRRFWKKR